MVQSDEKGLNRAVHHPDVLDQRVRALVLVSTSSGDLSGGPLGGLAPRVLALQATDAALATRYGHLWVRGALGKDASPAAVRATHEHFRAMPADTRMGILTAMQAIRHSDLFLLQAIVFTVAIAIVLVNIGLDIAYKFIDPRIKLV